MNVTVTRLGHLGDGIAEGPVFVAGALPGEVVEGAVENGRIAAPRILQPSPDRVRAPCASYKSCGGCALQHASDDFVAAWKRQVVQVALAAHGLEADLAPVITSPARSRRRAVLTGRRTKKGAMVGFHGRASELLVEPADCHLLLPEIMQGFDALRALTRLGASRKSELRLSVTWSEGGLDVAVSGGRAADGALLVELAALAGQYDLARLTWNDEVIATLRPPWQRFGAARVVPPPGAFLQATQDGERALLSVVASVVGGAARIVDLFSGCGTFSLPLAGQADVHAVEGEAAMLHALEHGWRQAPGLHQVTTEARDLFRRPLLPDELRRFDAAVLDPPRAGAEAQIAEIARAQVPVVAMVSCNPVSFARDAASLVEAGYVMGPVQVVDQFRWSVHTELAAGFTLA